MFLYVAQRFHNWMHSFGQPSDLAEVEALETSLREVSRKHRLGDARGRDTLRDVIAARVSETFGLDRSHSQFPVVLKFITSLARYEGLFVMPTLAPAERGSTSALWSHRDELLRQHQLFADFDETCDSLRLLACAIFDRLWTACPALLQVADDDGIPATSHLLHHVGDIGALVHELARAPSAPELIEQCLVERLRGTLDRHLIAASGGNPADPKGFSKTPKYANKSDIKDPATLAQTYLAGTPLIDILDQQVDMTIPLASRFEHHHILAGSGHGKTQTLQYLIAHDLQAVMDGKRSVVVLDSQGDLIRNISQLEVFAPGAPLHNRVVIIDPTDVEWPVSLNLFDVGQDRLKTYNPLERERLTNSILELYDFVLGTLLDAQMTQKQGVIFRYVTRLMLHIPDATIHTLRDLMEPGAEQRFAPHIAKLNGTARHFFETEFASKEFDQTKKQVLRRLWGILENQTFERMFSHPRSKLDLFAEMNAGKVILINTAKDLLKETGTEIFGRFFIALIAQAAQERAVLPQNKRMPTMVYIDEAADYFDRNIGLILSQARKYNVGMILAHQYLGQLSPGLQEAFAANTSIKFAGGVSAKDARTMASAMYCDPGLIEQQGKGSFATHIRGQTPRAVPMTFPLGSMEQLPRMTHGERIGLQEQMRARYAVHYSQLGTVNGADATGVDEAEIVPDPDEPTPYW